MALVTWDDIGSSLEQAENNKNQGNEPVPTNQNFPLSTRYGILDIVDTAYESTFQQKISAYKQESYTRTGAALTGCYVGLKAAYRRDYSTYRQSIATMKINTVPGSSGLFIIRFPFVSSGYTTYNFMICCAGTLSTGSFAGDSFLYSDSIGATREGTIIYINASVSSRYNVKFSSNEVSQYATYIEQITNAINYNGLGSLLCVEQEFYMDGSFIPGIDPSAYGKSNWQQDYLAATNLPIWDISEENHIDDILAYLTTGARNNVWYEGSGDAYVPVINADVEDTTTVWNVQSLYDTNPVYRINYYCTDLGSVSVSVRSQWRGNIFIDSIKTPITGETFREFNKDDIVLYDKSYSYHKSVFSIRYSNLYDKIIQFIYSRMGDGSYTPPASETWLGNVWLTKSQAYIIRLGMCIYNSNKISNIVYVDLKYDPTTGISWGTLVDNGDDSYVNITVVSDDSIEDAGGVTNIDVPDADDGYTGTIDNVNSDEDSDYDDTGSGDLPEDTITPVSGNGVSIGGRFCTTYQVSTAQLKAISSYFWNDGADGFMSKYINAVNNPIESIISVGYMPISVTGVGSDSVFIGNVNLTAQDPNCTGATVANTTQKIVIGTLQIPEVYSSFLDYQPYTNLTIFLPFIGFKTLPPNLFMGKSLKVEYAFDLITGGCKALLSANGKYVMCFDGDCMIKIPLTASNNSDVFMQRLRSAVEAGVNIMSAGVGTVATTSGGSITRSGERFSRSPSAAGKGFAMKRTSAWNETTAKDDRTYHSHSYGGAVASVVGAGLDIAMAKHTYETFGGASSAVASVEPMSVYVIIDSPTVQYPATYNHNCGKPCELSKYLSSLTGYTEVDGGIDLNGIPCTDAEREEIHALLVSGVYL